MCKRCSLFLDLTDCAIIIRLRRQENASSLPKHHHIYQSGTILHSITQHSTPNRQIVQLAQCNAWSVRLYVSVSIANNTLHPHHSPPRCLCWCHVLSIIHPYKVCAVCGKSFESRYKLIRHAQGVHLKLRYQCDLCQRTYSQSSDVRRHKKAVHGML